MSLTINAPMPGTELYAIARLHLRNSRGKHYLSRDQKDVDLVRCVVDEITAFKLGCGDDKAPVAWRGVAYPVNPDTGAYYMGEIPICAQNVAFSTEEGLRLLEKYREEGLAFDKEGLVLDNLEKEVSAIRQLLSELSNDAFKVEVGKEFIIVTDSDGNKYDVCWLYQRLLYDILPIDKDGHMDPMEGVDEANLRYVVLNASRRGVRVMFDADIYAPIREIYKVAAVC